MREFLFCDKWDFAKTALNCECPERAAFKRVAIPHDWMIYDTNNLYENSIGWYRREISLAKLKSCYGYTPGERAVINFDGVYMDSSIFFNGQKIFEWKYGYSAFSVDITDYLQEENELLVKVVYESPNSRWYSGAGIYRDVNIRFLPAAHIAENGIYFHTSKNEDAFDVNVSVRCMGALQTGDSVQIIVSTDDNSACSACPDPASDSCSRTTIDNGACSACPDPASDSCSCPSVDNGVCSACSGPSSGCSCASAAPDYFNIYIDSKELTINTSGLNSDSSAEFSFSVSNPILWELENPGLYTLTAELLRDGKVIDSYSEKVGFRELSFTTDKGLFLNGRHIKLHGVCEHHDFGCLGSAFNMDALRRKFKKLKEMGVNSIRTSHNMPDRHLMQLADEEGMLILSEGFDMWEMKKTDFDYARFFPEWYERDVESWIMRDRNHPSLLMWSIGNEIQDTHASEHGMQVMLALRDAVRKYDYLGNAPISLGSNYMPWENTQKCADILKFAGYNYAEGYYAPHHEAHPDWVIYGSETASNVYSRDVYHFPLSNTVLCDEDEQCSSLGNAQTSWGALSVEKCISDDRDCEFSLGHYIWTGFDYIGEPTPYQTKNSYFGQIDTAGFAKSPFYIYRSEWKGTDSEAQVHIFPYWNFSRGQLIDLRVTSNMPEVELIVNEKSLGKKPLNHSHGTEFVASWQLPYEPGEVKAIAYNENGEPVAESSRHSFGDSAKIIAKADKSAVTADGRSLCFIEISTVDADGYPVDNAMDEIMATVSGPAIIAGMDNGDSTDYDSYKSNVRKLFNGRLLLVLQAGFECGRAELLLEGSGLEPAKLSVDIISAEAPGAALKQDTNACDDCAFTIPIGIEDPIALDKDFTDNKKRSLSGSIHLRQIEISSSNGTVLSNSNPETLVSLIPYPANTDCRDFELLAVNDSGVPVKYVSISPADDSKLRWNVRAQGDGAFKIRAIGRNKAGRVSIISELEFKTEGLGTLCLSPYEFVYGALYNEAIGIIGNGNEKGLAGDREALSGVVFKSLDFGPDGSDTITLPVFTLDGKAYDIYIFDGKPSAATINRIFKSESLNIPKDAFTDIDSAKSLPTGNIPEEDSLLLHAVYQKPSIWNVYQEESYKLNRKLSGIRDLCFIFKDKFHVKGFVFK